MAQVYDHLTLFQTDSPYVGDYNKNCKLTPGELDSNFLFLEGSDVQRMSYSDNTLTLNKKNGEQLSVTISTNPTPTPPTPPPHPHVHPEKTGQPKPVLTILDSANKLPHCNQQVGDRYVVYEGADKDSALYTWQEVKAQTFANGWVVPTATQWDSILNYLESPAHKNHDSMGSGWKGQDQANYLKTIKFGGLDTYNLNIYPNSFIDEHGHHIWGESAYWSSTPLSPSTPDTVYTKGFSATEGRVYASYIGTDRARLGLRLVKPATSGYPYDYGTVHNTQIYDDLRSLYKCVKIHDGSPDGLLMLAADVTDASQDLRHYHKDDCKSNITTYEYDGYEWKSKKLEEGDSVVVIQSNEPGAYFGAEYRVINGILKIVNTGQSVFTVNGQTGDVLLTQENFPATNDQTSTVTIKEVVDSKVTTEFIPESVNEDAATHKKRRELVASLEIEVNPTNPSNGLPVDGWVSKYTQVDLNTGKTYPYEQPLPLASPSQDGLLGKTTQADLFNGNAVKKQADGTILANLTNANNYASYVKVEDVLDYINANLPTWNN